MNFAPVQGMMDFWKTVGLVLVVFLSLKFGYFKKDPLDSRSCELIGHNSLNYIF